MLFLEWPRNNADDISPAADKHSTAHLPLHAQVHAGCTVMRTTGSETCCEEGAIKLNYYTFILLPVAALASLLVHHTWLVDGASQPSPALRSGTLPVHSTCFPEARYMECENVYLDIQ